MKRIDTATKAPDLFGTGKHGFRNSNLPLGVAATDFNADWPNNLQEEVARVIEAAGITLDGAVYTQLLQALRSNALLVGVDGGAANAYVVAFTPAIPALVDGMLVWFKATNTNTGATTVNVSGLGVKDILGGAHAVLQGGEIVANGKCLLVWNAALDKFVLIGCTGGALQVSAGTQSNHAATLAQVSGFRNKMANGGFRTNQRNYVSNTPLVAGVPSTGVGYGHDGVRAGPAGLTYTFVQSLGPTLITISAGTAIMAAEDADIEGGSYVLSWSGNSLGRVGINGAAPAGTYVASPILIPAANAGQQITAEFGLGTLGQVQLERGGKTSFEWPPNAIQLLRCQRYLPAIGPSSAGVNGVVASGQCIANNQAVFPLPLRTTPRIPPTGLITVNPLNFQASNAGYTGATTSSIVLFGTTSNYGVGIQVNTAGPALVAGNASVLVSIAAGGLMLFTGAEI